MDSGPHALSEADEDALRSMRASHVLARTEWRVRIQDGHEAPVAKFERQVRRVMGLAAFEGVFTREHARDHTTAGYWVSILLKRTGQFVAKRNVVGSPNARRGGRFGPVDIDAVTARRQRVGQ